MAAAISSPDLVVASSRRGNSTSSRHRDERTDQYEGEERLSTVTKYQAYFGGELAGAASGETMDVIAPATGEVIAQVPRCSAEDVDRAVDAARAAWESWQDKTPND